MVYFMFFVLIRKKAQYENIDADIVQGEEEPQISEEKGDLTVHVLWCHSGATFTQKKTAILISLNYILIFLCYL